jgi:membrane complex biogenesis BtpA family protein
MSAPSSAPSSPRSPHFDKLLIGMVHVGALPGTPRAEKPIRDLIDQAIFEAQILANTGFDAIIIENMHDAPYVNGPHGPEITSAMTAIVGAVRAAIAPSIRLGVQILSRGEKEALAVAHATGADFIRCENFVFAHVADEGLLAHAAAGPLLRYRRNIGATNVLILADIQKKHASHAITADLSLADLAHGAEFFGADAVIVTGTVTGQPTDPLDVEVARKATRLPIVVGSGVTPDTVATLFAHADALIVGTAIKHDAHWSNAVDPIRAQQMVDAARAARNSAKP